MSQFFPLNSSTFGPLPFGVIPAVDPDLSTYDTSTYYRLYPGGQVHVAIEEADTYRYATPQPYGDHTISPLIHATVPSGSGAVVVRMSDGSYSNIYFTSDGVGLMSFVVTSLSDFIGGAGSNLDDPGVVDTVESYLASGSLIVSLEALTTPYDAPYIDIFFVGLIYPGVAATTKPPLRQWPRDDGLRRVPGRAGAPGPTSLQGSLRRGPRGNYK